jgi:hypothetical protein
VLTGIWLRKLISKINIAPEPLVFHTRVAQDTIVDDVDMCHMLRTVSNFRPVGVIATRLESFRPTRTLIIPERYSCNHNRRFSSYIPQPPLFKMDPILASIIEQVKVDITTPTQEQDNARQLEEVSRSFICKYTS